MLLSVTVCPERKPLMKQVETGWEGRQLAELWVHREGMQPETVSSYCPTPWVLGNNVVQPSLGNMYFFGWWGWDR